METITLKIPNISCEHCVRFVEKELATVEGVSVIKSDVATKEVTLTSQTPEAAARARSVLAEANYPAE